MKNFDFSKAHPKLSQKGFSIISMLIGAVIGTFVIGVAIKVYTESKLVFDARSAMSAANENGRFAISDLRRIIVMAGRDVPASQSAFGDFDSEGIVDGGSDSTASDILAIKHAKGPSCNGNISSLKTLRFKIKSNVLVCEEDGTDYPLVSGIHVMRVLYGVNENLDGYANRYLTASAVETEGKWDNVVAVRIALIASSDKNLLPITMRAKSAETIQLLGLDYTPPTVDKLYRAVSTTISLRNLNTIVSRQ